MEPSDNPPQTFIGWVKAAPAVVGVVVVGRVVGAVVLGRPFVAGVEGVAGLAGVEVAAEVVGVLAGVSAAGLDEVPPVVPLDVPVVSRWVEAAWAT